MLEKAGGICLMLENESSGKAIYDTAMEIFGRQHQARGNAQSYAFAQCG